MRRFGLKLLAACLVFGILACCCLGLSAEPKKSSFELGLRLLQDGKCSLAVSAFRNDLAREPTSIDARLLLGIALDCSGNPKSVTQLFGEIWNSDLDPQEQTADLHLVQTAFQSGWNPSLHTSEAIYLVALLCYRTG